LIDKVSKQDKTRQLDRGQTVENDRQDTRKGIRVGRNSGFDERKARCMIYGCKD
jgi:hypothetical protein